MENPVVKNASPKPTIGRELALCCARGERLLQLGGHPQEHGPAPPRSLPRPAARLERDGEAGGEDADGDVVEALACAANLAGEDPLQLTRHPDEHILTSW